MVINGEIHWMSKFFKAPLSFFNINFTYHVNRQNDTKYYLKSHIIEWCEQHLGYCPGIVTEDSRVVSHDRVTSVVRTTINYLEFKSPEDLTIFCIGMNNFNYSIFHHSV